MLASIVGQVDSNSAAVLIAGFICLCVAITALIVKRRSMKQISNEFELAKLKQQGENDRAMFAAETDRGYKYKQVEQNLITSHRVGGNEE